MGQKIISLSTYFIKKNGEVDDLATPGTDGTPTNGAKNGLMSGADKYKLDGISSNANNYIHPNFTNYALGDYNIEIDNNGHVINASSKIGTFTELQTLINNASNGDIIELTKNYKNSGEENPIVINDKELIIQGNGHILDGHGTSMIIQQNSSSIRKLTINNTTFINGERAIDCDYVVINDCLFCNNIAPTSSSIDNKGGAIKGGNLQIKNSTFINNQAAQGGAIYTQSGSNQYISNCTFFNNDALNGQGGGIYGTSSLNLTISDCIFSNNDASQGKDVYFSVNSEIYNCQISSTSSACLYKTTNREYVSGSIQNSLVANSTNPVTSGAVYSAINSLNSQINSMASNSMNIEIITEFNINEILSYAQKTSIDDEVGMDFYNYCETESISLTSNTIYLVPSDTLTYYYEFLVFTDASDNQVAELIGTTQADLTNYIQKQKTIGLIKNDGTIMTSGNGANNFAIGNHTHSEYVTTADIDEKLNTSDLLEELNNIIEDLIEEGE